MVLRKESLTLLAVLVVAGTVVGCASLPKGPSDEDLIRETLAIWKAGIESEDIDMLMSVVSEDFVGEGGANKPAFRQFIAGARDSGTLSGAQMDIEGMVPVIEGDMATAENLGLSSSRGAVVIDFDLKKEDDGIWRIVNMQIY